MADLHQLQQEVMQIRDVANLAASLTPGVPVFSGEEMKRIIRTLGLMRVMEKDELEARAIDLQDEVDTLRAELSAAKNDGRDYRDFDLSLEELVENLERTSENF